jgi:hypothetical protein
MQKNNFKPEKSSDANSHCQNQEIAPKVLNFAPLEGDLTA